MRPPEASASWPTSRLNGAKTYYEEKHDKGTFVKNIITDNILPGDIYIRAKELHFVTDAPRAVFLVRQVGRADVASVDVLSGMFPDKQQDFVLSINETDIAIVKQIAPARRRQSFCRRLRPSSRRSSPSCSSRP